MNKKAIITILLAFVAMAGLTSSVTTNGFRRTSPKLSRYLKRCYNEYGE